MPWKILILSLSTFLPVGVRIVKIVRVCKCVYVLMDGCVCCSACGPLSYHARHSVILTRRLLVFFLTVAPTWERFAEVMHDAEAHIDPHNEEDYDLTEYEMAKKLKRPVLIGKVDCVEHEAWCDSLDIMAYPTLMLYVAGDDNKVRGVSHH